MCVLTISEDAEGGAADAARTRFICLGSREGHGQIQSSKTCQGMRFGVRACAKEYQRRFFAWSVTYFLWLGK